MRKRNIIGIIFILAVGQLSAQSQLTEHEILNAIESQSASLSAARARMASSQREARVGNSLPDPKIGYTHMWGANGNSSQQDELTATQGFDFPTAYIHRGKIAQLKTQTADMQYQSERIAVLLEAKLLILQINHLKEVLKTDSMRYADALYVEQMNKKRSDAGEISALEENKVSMQMLSAKNNMERTRMALNTACIVLSSMAEINISPEDDIMTSAVIVLPSLDSLISIAREKDPRLAALQADITTREKEKSLSVSMALPKLSAGYKYSQASGNRFNGVILGVSIPVFENRNKVRLAKLRIDEAQHVHSDVDTDIITSITSQYEQAISLQHMIAKYHADSFGQKNSTLLRKALEYGEINVLEYFVELDMVYQNIEQYQTLMFDYASLCAKLNKYSL